MSVIVHVDTDRAGEALVNQRLAYVALSRGRYDAQIFTNDKAQLVNAFSRDVSHRSAIEQAPQQALILFTIDSDTVQVLHIRHGRRRSASR